MDSAKTNYKTKKTATPIAGPNLYFYFNKLKHSSPVPGTLRIDPSNSSANRHLPCPLLLHPPPLGRLLFFSSKPVETDVQVGIQQKFSCIKFKHSVGFMFFSCSNLDWHSIVANLWFCCIPFSVHPIFCLNFSEVCDVEGWLIGMWRCDKKV